LKHYQNILFKENKNCLCFLAFTFFKMYFKFLFVLLTITSIIIDVGTAKLDKRAAAAGRSWPIKKIPYAYSNIMEFSFEQRHHIGNNTLSFFFSKIIIEVF
jgi:hypothetical protein